MFAVVCSLLLVASAPGEGATTSTPADEAALPAASALPAPPVAVSDPAAAPAPTAPAAATAPTAPTASPVGEAQATPAADAPGPTPAASPDDGATGARSRTTPAAAPVSSRVLGVGLAAAGGALAVAGAVGFTLVEALTRPDDPSAKRDDALETFTQTGGFVAVAVASVSAVLVLCGGAVLLADVVQPANDAGSARAAAAPRGD